MAANNSDFTINKFIVYPMKNSESSKFHNLGHYLNIS